jgi:hypothetical protein
MLETGGDILKSSQSFHERVALIKRHLSSQSHPIHKVFRTFKKRFYKENIHMLRKYNDDENLAFPEHDQSSSMQDTSSLSSRSPTRATDL